MPIIKWQPFQQPNHPRREMNNPTEEENWVPLVPTFRMEEPAVDIYQDKDNLYVEIPLAGIKPENVNISIKYNNLTISGKVEESNEQKGKDYLRKEVRKGSFQRTIKLPVAVKDNKAKAQSEMGILKITIPKADKSALKHKKIPIKIK